MRLFCLPALALTLTGILHAQQPRLPSGPAIDAEAHRMMASTHANGLAIALIDHGQVKYVQAYGIRDAKGDPLKTDSIMYGASITKTVFAYTVMHLVDQHKLALDTPLKDYLDKPLPDYALDPVFPDKYPAYKDLANDPRWQQITARMCLTHSAGFANFYFLESDQKLRIHFDPGTHFSYSGEGFILLQFVIEHGKAADGLGLDVGQLTSNIFTHLNMPDTNLVTVTRPDFPARWTDGWNDQGQPQPHDKRTKPRAAGSMNTTIADLSKFAAALVRGDGLSPAAFQQIIKPSLHIGVAYQFPTLQPDLPADKQRKDLNAGLGVVTFDGPQGHGFFKGGHDEQTANTLVCVVKSQRCALILSNDVRAEAGFAQLVKFLLGETGVPFDWEYGGNAGKS